MHFILFFFNRDDESDDKTLASIGGKDQSLDLFHLIGKVLYCKRTEEPEICQIRNIENSRNRNQLIIEPEELLDKLPTSTESFVGFMHQSYLDFFSSIQDASQAVENLSYAEPFFNEWTVSNFRTKKSGKKSISKTVHIFLGFTFEFLFVLRAGHTRSVNVRDAL